MYNRQRFGRLERVRWAVVIVAVNITVLFAQQPLAKDPGAFDPSAPAPVARRPATPAAPAPHLADGRPDFGG